MAKKYYWLKLQNDFFKRHDIRIIEEMPNGKDYILFYMKLLVESISHEGNLRFSETIPYNEDMLSTITHTNIDIVRSAVKIFSELDLMTLLDDGTLFMNETAKMVGAETDWAKKKEDYRRRKALKVTAKELPAKYPYKLGDCTVYNKESIRLPNGENWIVDEKRYSGNGKIAIANSGGKCSMCGVEKSSSVRLVIHHDNGYSNNIEDLQILCTSCHGKRHGQKEDMSYKSIEIDKELELDIEKDIDNIEPEFLQFWEAIKKRGSKKTAKELYKKLRKSSKLPPIETLLDILSKWRQSGQWDNETFIPHATTWLRQERWEDEIPKPMPFNSDTLKTTEEQTAFRWFKRENNRDPSREEFYDYFKSSETQRKLGK